MARHFRGTGHIVRFIEFMDVGATNGWRMDDVVPAARDRAHDRRRIAARSRRPELRAAKSPQRWRYRDGGGEIGVIASVTQAFCRDCTRARLSTDGKLYTCLFAHATATTCAALAARRLRRRGRSATRSPAIWQPARRPLLGDPHGEHGARAEGRDELHRRLGASPIPSVRRERYAMHLDALVEFLDGLARNNNRPWFVWNKPAYDILRQEFEELVADLVVRVAGIRSRHRPGRPEESDVPDLPRHALLQGQDAVQDALQRGARRPLEARAGAGVLLPHRPRRQRCSPAAGSIDPDPSILLARATPHRDAPAGAHRACCAIRRFEKTYGGLAERGRARASAERLRRRHCRTSTRSSSGTSSASSKSIS